MLTTMLTHSWGSSAFVPQNRLQSHIQISLGIVCFSPKDRLLSSLEIVGFYTVWFKIGSSALSPRDRLLWPGSPALTHRSSALAKKIVRFGPKIVCFRPRSSALTQRSSAFVGIVCFHPFQDRLLWHPRIVRFRPYSSNRQKNPSQPLLLPVQTSNCLLSFLTVLIGQKAF